MLPLGHTQGSRSGAVDLRIYLKISICFLEATAYMLGIGNRIFEIPE